MQPEQIITQLINHKYVRLTNRGNSAIKHAIRLIKTLTDKEFILTPDQGGWLTYKQFSIKEGFKVKELKTDNGLINPQNLNLENTAAIIIAQPAGYFAAQDMKQIYNACKHKCYVILDITGSIGDKNLSNGNYADILLGSFGEWKPVNLEYGGFISFKQKDLHQKSQKIPLNQFDHSYNAKLIEKLNQLPGRYELFNKTARKIKSDLKRLNIIHKDKEGINVVVQFDSEEEKQKIIKYCALNKYQYTLCPRYIRVNAKAISIEVKRL